MKQDEYSNNKDIMVVGNHHGVNIVKKKRTRASGDTTNLKYYLPQGNYFVAYTRFAGCSFAEKESFLNHLGTHREEKNNYFYEVIVDDFPVYEYYDIDDKDFGDLSVDEYVDWFLGKRREFRDDFTLEDVRLVKADGHKKSIHLIIRSCVWETTRELKMFVKDFVEEKKVRCDLSVYHSYRLFRTVFSTKEDGAPRPFCPVGDYPLNEYFVQYDFFGEDDDEKSDLRSWDNVPKAIEQTSVTQINTTNKTLTSLLGKISKLYPEFDQQMTNRDGIIHLIRKQKGKCPSHPHLSHGRQNAFILITDTEVFVCCFTHRKLVFIGTYRKRTKDEKIQRMIEYNTKFVNQPLSPLPDAQVVSCTYVNQELTEEHVQNTEMTVIKSPTGSGKTVFMNEHVLERFERILCLSFRRSFACYISASLGFENYLTTPNMCQAKRLVCSVEKLWKFEREQKYDLLVLDEFVLLMDQLACKATCKDNLYNCQRRFIRLLQETNTVLVMDANMQAEHIQLLQMVTERKPVVYQNMDISPTRKCVLSYSKDMTLQVLKNLLESGKKVVIPYTISRHELKAIEPVIGDKYKGLILCKDTADKEKIFSNLTEMSKEYDYVGYTNTLLAGVSVENAEYTVGVAFISRSTTTPPQMIQMLNRFRNVENVYLFIDQKNLDKPVFETDEEIEEFITQDIRDNGLNRTNVVSNIYDVDNRCLRSDPVKFINFLKYRLDGSYYSDYMKHTIQMLQENRWNVVVDRNDFVEGVNDDVKHHRQLATLSREEELNHIAGARNINRDYYLQLMKKTTRTAEEEFEYQKFRFVQTFKVNPDNEALVEYMKKHHHSSGYSRYYKLKNLLTIYENPLVDECASETEITEDINGRVTWKHIVHAVKPEEKTKFFLYQTFTTLSMDIVNVIFDFFGDKLSHTLESDEGTANRRRLEFYSKTEISVDLIHVRYKLVFDWIHQLGFRSTFDFDTVINSNQRNRVILDICNRYSAYEAYKYISRVFESQGKKFQKFSGNLTTRNYTELSKFVFSKIESVLGVIRIASKQRRVRGSSTDGREYVYRLQFTKDAVNILTNNGEYPCLYWREDIEHLPSNQIAFLERLQSMHTR